MTVQYTPNVLYSVSSLFSRGKKQRASRVFCRWNLMEDFSESQTRSKWTLWSRTLSTTSPAASTAPVMLRLTVTSPINQSYVRWFWKCSSVSFFCVWVFYWFFLNQFFMICHFTFLGTCYNNETSNKYAQNSPWCFHSDCDGKWDDLDNYTCWCCRISNANILFCRRNVWYFYPLQPVATSNF